MMSSSRWPSTDPRHACRQIVPIFSAPQPEPVAKPGRWVQFAECVPCG